MLTSHDTAVRSHDHHGGQSEVSRAVMLPVSLQVEEKGRGGGGGGQMAFHLEHNVHVRNEAMILRWKPGDKAVMLRGKAWGRNCDAYLTGVVFCKSEVTHDVTVALR